MTGGDGQDPRGPSSPPPPPSPWLVGTDTWPAGRRLLIPAVEAESGVPVVWDADSGVPLSAAVAASSAFPGAAPAVPIGERHFIDGALRAGTNPDLAAGARMALVVEPMAREASEAAGLEGTVSLQCSRRCPGRGPRAFASARPGGRWVPAPAPPERSAPGIRQALRRRVIGGK
ncbi:patatin-like phospholipase family protein [Streptomyces sp. NPDC096136]|uniref:patatin-like phospholipase family protein n=1 Tax=Streptomyces sp. NPDC096136 TaxID=3366076 RepID=UPI00382A795C